MISQRLLYSFSVLLLAGTGVCQSRLPSMPRYERYSKVRAEIFDSVKGGNVNVTWAPDGKSFQFVKDGNLIEYSVATKKTADATPYQTETKKSKGDEMNDERMPPGRGRQFGEVFSPKGSFRAFFKNDNVHVETVGGGNPIDVTDIGNERSRTKFGQASWVYGEELGVREAMWWSPDGKKLAFYGFDDSKVPDYYVPLGLTQIQDKLEIEAYPKAGVSNPIVSLSVYDLSSGKTAQVDTGFANAALGEYVYDVRWSPDGTELLFNRTNRHQNHLQLVAANPNTGQCRVVVDESWSKTWNDNHPEILWLDPKQGKPREFLWLSERTGFRNIYLGDISGRPLQPVTTFDSFEVGSILKVDEKRGIVFFTARDGDNPYLQQVHRVDLDGSNEQRITDRGLSHSVEIAPDCRHLVDIEQNADTPAKTVLLDDEGKVLDTLGTADSSKFVKLGLKKAERIKFKAADGVTYLYGVVQFPSDFEPSKKYPLIVSVYGGPDSGGSPEHFALPSPFTELGFVVASFDGRGTAGRGKAFEDALYDKLGVVEIDDQAAGVKYLDQRPYIDSKRVGIYGTSYGGYASLMCLLRYPEVFQVAVSGSPVTDWRNYDSIYTERYMGLPIVSDNMKGYAAATAAKYADDLKGRLMLYFGTADDNVHPSNMMQLVRALQTSGKSFDMMVGPDEGHSAINFGRQWEYFIDYLIIHPDR